MSIVTDFHVMWSYKHWCDLRVLRHSVTLIFGLEYILNTKLQKNYANFESLVKRKQRTPSVWETQTAKAPFLQNNLRYVTYFFAWNKR